jgi:hypothetical protein
VQVNKDPHSGPQGKTVEVHYSRDKKGRVTDIHIQAGPKATREDIQLHARTVKSMKRYSGMSFHAQKLQDKIHGWVNKNGVPPVGSKAWEAKLEIQKLPHVIDNRMAKLAKGNLTPQQRQKLEKEIAHLEHQLDGYKKDFKAMDKDPGKGFVAAKARKDKNAPRKGEADEWANMTPRERHQASLTNQANGLSDVATHGLKRAEAGLVEARRKMDSPETSPAEKKRLSRDIQALDNYVRAMSPENPQQAGRGLLQGSYDARVREAKEKIALGSDGHSGARDIISTAKSEHDAYYNGNIAVAISVRTPSLRHAPLHPSSN